MFRSSSEIEDVLIEAELEPDDARLLAASAKPTIWLKTRAVDSEDKIAIGATKIGGRPDLPASVAWPIRPAYPDIEARTKHLRRDIANPDSAWSWATPEQRVAFSKESADRIRIVENPFPLGFLAQINFAEMWAAGPLDPDMPRSGVLSLFFDLIEAPWGFDPNDRVAFAALFQDVGETLTRRDAPTPIVPSPQEWRLRPLACVANPCVTPTPPENVENLGLALSADCVEQLQDWWGDDDNMYATEGGVDWKCHRIGGWPTPIQGDMQTECALVTAGHYCGDSAAYRAPELEPVRATASDWLMLAQIGTDEKGGVTWGDNGQVYVWIRRDDLAARRFDRAHLITQCH
ncbi:YwqG family protein [Terrarubrum flagellatum]|uniref:YwqG family protein n=1 Tax=Terrirubrum flagellatum TaxID=2895980 RepID=UPI00314530FD